MKNLNLQNFCELEQTLKIYLISSTEINIKALRPTKPQLKF